MTRRLGFEPVRYTPRNSLELRRDLALRECGIDVVLDVGANAGQYAAELRRRGFDGRIVSFEPVEAAYAKLDAAAAADAKWKALHLALGAASGTAAVNVSSNLVSSSLRPITERHLAAEPGSAYISTEAVHVVRLDDLHSSILDPGERALLKLDVQGYELQVLRGAAETLRQVRVVEAELSLVELYAGQALAHEVSALLYDAGFVAVALVAAFRDRSSPDLLGVDSLFIRSDA